MKTYALCQVLSCFVIGAQILFATSACGKRIVCWYNEFTDFVYDQPKDIPLELCTDIIFQWTQTWAETWEVIVYPWIATTEFKSQFTEQTTRPKLFLGVGSIPEHWSEMTAEASKRMIFITSVLSLVRRFGFDGINIQWNNPRSLDRDNYVKLAKELVERKPRHLLLTCTLDLRNIPYYTPRNLTGFNFQILSELFDWINVSPELHEGFDRADVPSPLYRRRFDYENGRQNHNLHDCLETMVQQGAPRHKLMLGLNFEGKTFTVNTENNERGEVSRYLTSLNALTNASNPYGNPGPDTDKEGFLYYSKICPLVDSGKFGNLFDHEGKCPYAMFAEQFIGYEDERSIRIKMEYVKNHGYGGAYVKHIHADDFNGDCGSKYPLLHAVHSVLKENRLPEPEVDPVKEILLKRYVALGIPVNREKCP